MQPLMCQPICHNYLILLRGRPAGLPLWPFANRVVVGGRRYPHHFPRLRLVDRLPTSFVGLPWPAQTVRIARAAHYLITLFVGQATTASPAAERRLNSPRL